MLMWDLNLKQAIPHLDSQVPYGCKQSLRSYGCLLLHDVFMHVGLKSCNRYGLIDVHFGQDIRCLLHSPTSSPSQSSSAAQSVSWLSLQEVFRLLEHVVTPTFGRSFPLEHVKDALAAAQSPSQSGAKIFLTS